MDNRPPPQDLEAEQAVLCACLIRAEIIPQVAAALPAEEYVSERHRIIAASLYDIGAEADLIQLMDRLRDKLEAIGGQDYLASIVGAVDSSAGWRHWAEIVHGLYQRRQVIIAAANTQAQAADLQTPLADTLGYIRDKIRAIEPAKSSDYVSNKTHLDAIIRRCETHTPPLGVATGFAVLDGHIGTLEPGTTCYLAAHSSTGKTALAVAILDNVLTHHEGTPIMYSLEMGSEAIMRRRLSARSGTALTRIRYGDIPHTDWPDVLAAADYLSRPAPLILDSPKFTTVETLQAYTDAIAQDKSINLIVVDHIQRMATRNKQQSRHHELSYVSRAIADIARDLQIPIIVLCQLRRGTEDNARPKLSDLKESGDLENNADIVLGLFRQDKQAPLMEVKCLKYRDGDAGWTEYLEFNRFIQRFRDGQKPDKGEPKKPDHWQDKA